VGAGVHRRWWVPALAAALLAPLLVRAQERPAEASPAQERPAEASPAPPARVIEATRESTRTPGGLRIAILPLVSYATGTAPLKDLRAELASLLAERGFDLVPDAALDEVLTRNRIRYTGGVDLEMATAFREGLKADAVLVGSVDRYAAGGIPALSMTLRLVSVADPPKILWMDAASRNGDDAPGLFDLGVITDPAVLRARVLEPLAASAASWASARPGTQGACDGAGRFAPRTKFRSAAFDPAAKLSVAVLPFVNETQRRNAGDIVTQQLVRELRTASTLQVVEPGLVRDQLLRFRITMPGGVSLDYARVISELVDADLVLAGYVRDYEDTGAVPKVSFTVLLLDRENNEVLWQSTSSNRGDDGVFFFDRGFVATAQELTCRMAKRVTDDLTALPRTAAVKRTLGARSP
jgi:TolB-like protein